MKHDIVYILKNDIDDAELIYSIRSVCQNFPYNKIWFAGGMPEHIKPDEYMYINQDGHNKWEKVSYSLKKICKNDEITEDFWLFNDDFFIMQPIDDFPAAVRGTMHHRIVGLKQKHQYSGYIGKLERTENLLRNRCYDTLDYALHVPMLINRAKALETLKEFDLPMFRCLYGNHHKIGGVIMDDVKIYDLDKEPTGEEIMLSTTDKSFKNGKVGPYIRSQFPDKCKYEER